MLRAGVDDCGSGPFKGYACVILHERGAAELESSGRALLAQSGLKRFHGREFNSGAQQEVAAYEGFVHAIGDVLRQYGEYAGFQLFHEHTYKAVFAEFAARVTGGVLSQFRDGVPEFATSKAGPLFWLARCLGEIPHRGRDAVAVELDQEQDDDAQAGTTVVGLAVSRGALLTTTSDALVRLTDAYKRQRFPTGPSIGTLSVGPSDGSILVQAADVLANFGMASLKSRLRTGSTSGANERARARIFESIMPCEPRPPDSSLWVTANNELRGEVDDNLRLVLTAFPARAETPARFETLRPLL